MSDNNPNNNNNQQQQQKQKGGGGGNTAGVSLSQNYTSANPNFKQAIGAAVCDSLGYVCAAGVSCLAVRAFNWMASKFKIQAVSADIHNRPLQINSQQQGGVHPMQLTNDIINNNPEMARKMQAMLNNRLADPGVLTVTEPTPDKVEEVKEETTTVPFEVVVAPEQPAAEVKPHGGGKNKNK